MTRKWQPRPIVVGEPGPMINTTPLIDLMLVLLVMLIVSIPLSTHKMPLDLPQPPLEGEVRTPPPVHRLDIDAEGRLAWDGRPIPDAELAPLLSALARDPAEPELHFAADGVARYERVDETLAIVLRAGVTRMGFVGNEAHFEALAGGA